MLKKNFLVFTLFLLFFYPLTAGAIPKLIVAPTGTEAVYYGDADGYLDYWANTFVPETSDYHGFVIPESGGMLSIAADFDHLTDQGIDYVYLLMDNGGIDYNVYFGGNELADVVAAYDEITETRQIDGYQPPMPYWGIRIATGDSGWTPISDPAFTGFNYKEYSAVLTYDPGLPDALHFFAVIDDNSKDKILDGDGLNSDDTFSPQTSSSGNFQPIPEPATMLLFGTGMIGLAALRRKIRGRIG